MEEQLDRVVSLPSPAGAVEEQMLAADLVRAMVARRKRGEGVQRIARELGVDRKTVRPWLRLGSWQPRRRRPRPRPVERFSEFIERRGPELGWNGVVLHRELAGLGFTGSYQQVRVDIDVTPLPIGAKAEGSERTWMGRCRSKTGRKV